MHENKILNDTQWLYIILCQHTIKPSHKHHVSPTPNILNSEYWHNIQFQNQMRMPNIGQNSHPANLPTVDDKWVTQKWNTL